VGPKNNCGIPKRSAMVDHGQYSIRNPDRIIVQEWRTCATKFQQYQEVEKGSYVWKAMLDMLNFVTYMYS
jgi:hypothetical protein